MSKNTYTAPTITVVLEEDETYRLYATSHSRTEIAGPRLFRAPPHPEIQWRHFDQTSAERDASLLRAYLAECEGGKRKETAAHVSLKNYWND